MLSSFTFAGLIVARALWSELQEYGLLDSSPQALTPGEERALREEARPGEHRRRGENYGGMH